MTDAAPSTRDLLEAAMLELRKLGARVDASDAAAKEPIAIIGQACRFPGGVSDAAEYWELLRAGVDAVAEVPPERWDIDAYYDPDHEAIGKMSSRWMGSLDEIDRFDASFFGISPREARSMDPQHRILLEVTWESLEHAGLVPETLVGSRTGVFVGMSSSGEYIPISADPTLIDTYVATGNSSSAATGRISYTLGLMGPSLAIDTACSSSLVAVHVACQSLRSRECDLALAGGVNLMLSPELTIAVSKLQALSPDGRCKTFDAAADGYVRGEGCGILTLKRLSDARAAGDQVLALIRGSAVNQDGRSNGFTAPSGRAQEALIRSALRQGEVDPAHVLYVEAHGTGTSLGDPIEILALDSPLRVGREQPLLVGSVKTNLGHLEHAAGVAGLMKVILALQHGEIPPHLHLQQLNPRIDWASLCIEVPTSVRAWPASPVRRIAGVSSFGVSGTNAHVLLEEAPASTSESSGRPRSDWLLTLSARRSEGLIAEARSLAHYLDANEDLELADICYTRALHRSHFEHRLAVVASGRAELIDRLERLERDANDRDPAAATIGRCEPSERPKIVFVFPGQGSQWDGMGRELLGCEPVFREAIEACDQAFREHVDWSLLDVLRGEESTAAFRDRLDVIQPTLFALEVGLAALWRSWGVEPDAVVGHSMGEVAAAFIAGALSLPDAARVICLRSALVAEVSGQGGMVMVELPLGEAQALLTGSEDLLSVAASNSPRTSVLSGELAALRNLIEELEGRGVFCRWIKVDFASHSPQMDPLGPELKKALRPLTPQAGSVPIHSTASGELIDGSEMDAAYWMRNLRDPVLFSGAVGRLVETGHELFVEVSPHPILSTAIGQGLLDREASGMVIPSMRRDAPELRTLLEGLGRLYVHGVRVDWETHYSDSNGRFVPLPTYRWQRERYWAKPPAGSGGWHGGPSSHPLLGQRLSLPVPELHFQGPVSAARQVYLADHCAFDVVVVPGAYHIALLLEAAAPAFGEEGCVLENVVFPRALAMEADEEAQLHVVLAPEPDGSFRFRVSSRRSDDGEDDGWVQHAAGILGPGPRSAGTPASIDLEQLQRRMNEELSTASTYDAILESGIDLGPSFRWFGRLCRGPGESLARFETPDGLRAVGRLHPALIDACFQTLAGPLLEAMSGSEEVSAYVPFSLDRLRFFGASDGSELWCHARLREGDGVGETHTGDLRLFERSGRVVAEIEGFCVKRATKRGLVEGARDPLTDLLYEVAWEPQKEEPEKTEEPTPRETSPGFWLICADTGGVGKALCHRLEQDGASCVVLDAEHWLAAGGGEEAFATTLAAAPPGLPCIGAVHMWSLDAASEVTLETLMAAQTVGCISIAHLVQALVRAGDRDTPPLWLVTRGADDVDGSPALSLAQAPVSGVTRTIAQEHPELCCRRIDLDPEGSESESVESLIREVRIERGEDEVACRGGSRHVARLVRSRPPDMGSTPMGGAGCYLITGGLGGLGLKLARWLIGQGARHLLLLGRRGASGAQLEEIDELRADGVSVEVIQADVSKRADLVQVLDDIDRGGHPLAGVFHLAMVLDDSMLLNQSRARFERVLTPKLCGAWNLHELTLDLELDHFVLFSSGASLLGSPGQSNYAAANAFLDGLAHRRRAEGLPALSLNWGPFSEVGQAAATPQRGERMGLRGMESLTPDEGLAAMGRMLGSSSAQVGILALDVRRYLDFFPAAADQSLWRRVAEETHARARSRATRGELRKQLDQLEPAKQNTVLQEHLLELVGWALRLDVSRIEPRTPWSSLGLDSLMALEIKNRLELEFGIQLPASLLFSAAHIEGLTSSLLQRADLVREPGSAPQGEPRRGGGDESVDLDELSAEELANRLEETLGS